LTLASRPGVAGSELARTQRFRVAAVLVALGGGALLFGPLAGSLVLADHVDFVVFLSALALPVLFWKVPASPVIFLVAAATSVERLVDRAPDAFMAWIPLYRSFSETYGVSGGQVLPIELVFGLAVLVWLARAIAERRLTFRRSHLFVGLTVLVLASVLSEGFGLARGGVFHISMWELRPYAYLWLAYLLASQLLTGRSAFFAVLWGMVIGTGLKGLEGTERVVTMGNIVPRPDAILEHDEAFFFSCFIVLTIALWVFGQRGHLRRVATLFLPLVVVADLGNNRRVAWIMLPAMLLALAVVAYLRIPERRKAIAWTVGLLLVLGSGYVAAFRGSTSLIATPAHAIWSQFSPDPRDASSNLYRRIENVNLGLDIRSSPILGEGFGVPIAHPIPVFDATDLDPFINFIPHNNILYIWVRMGIFGMLAFWFVVGAAVIAACRLTRHQDRLLALLGSLVLAAMIAWLFEGWYDKGIVSFRVVILVGCLLGAVEAARSMPGASVASPEPEPELVLEDYEEGQRDGESIPSGSPQPLRLPGLQRQPAQRIGRGRAEAG
jgi:hypothetical protein